ncbi:hypothetical protein KUTeg_013829 [Tegillarca granosa]|uniref:Protein RFT1 homolog n=1 Tax=Tegillarca granosa TaxID=220873 RepID=A0ABQ9EZY3_TEGGR|nr:hypothetical protein KUTeg_013829 [Tegillarca granosa]
MAGSELLVGAAKAAGYNMFLQVCITDVQKFSMKYIYFRFPVSILCCGIIGCVWIFLLETPDPEVIPNYNLGVASFAISTIINTLARPHFIVGQAHLFVKLRVLYALVYTGLYYGFFYYYVKQPKKNDDFVFQEPRDFFPKPVKDKEAVDERLLGLAWSFSKQSVLKQLLTEGEKYVMTVFGVLGFGDQGVYDVINNLGSMVPRFVFLPIEESGRLFFSQSLLRGHDLNQQSEESIDIASKLLQHLLKIVSLIGSIIIVFGFSYSYLALDIYGGSVLSSGSGPLLLRWYCLYVLVIAVNGTTECFFFSVMSKNEIDRYNRKMLVFSAVFLVSSLFLTRHFGSVGFILANCLNMGTRIAHSIYFISTFYKGSNYRPLRGLVPSPLVVTSLVISFIVTSISEMFFCCSYGAVYRLLHIAVGGLCLLVVLVTIFVSEKDLINFVKEQYNSRHKAKAE